MSFNIEGWVPTPLEESLMDGSFDKIITESATPVIDDDLLDVQEFNAAMEELKNEIASWQS
ncbi:MAG: hypothetical protein IKA13_01395 [Bacteroidales bacterium]|nr:hypothetical protein [Bacteroidales bacterium]MBR2474961.1 hypothetical protein [Bacteroidaceae bacterium]